MPVIRPFALADVLLVYRLQRLDVPLAIEHTLTHPRPPLWLALTAPWPWAALGVATYVLRERWNKELAGYVQLLKRSARPEADLLHIAPVSIGNANGTGMCDDVWHRLLSHCSFDAAQHGLQRLYVSVPDGGPELLCLKEAGYSFYARETIYRLPEGQPAGLAPAGFRRQLPQDSWALQRLYAQCTPCLVQQAEGALVREAGSPPLSWWEPDRWRGAVLAPAGEVRGAVQVHVGRAGDWLRILGANTLTAREMRQLVEHGLRMLAAAPLRRRSLPVPIYATVRDYEVGLSGALTGFGFAPFTDRARFVRHTFASRRKTVVATTPALETRHEIPVRGHVHMREDRTHRG